MIIIFSLTSKSKSITFYTLSLMIGAGSELWCKCSHAFDSPSRGNSRELVGQCEPHTSEFDKLFVKAREEEDVAAQYKLGTIYENGHGVEKNEGEAVQWYQKAAAQGHAGAQNNLARMLENGHGTQKNEGEGVQ